MPKSKTVLSNKTQVSTRVKFKIGTRTSTRSALRMSNSDLIAVVNGNDSGRDKQIARQMLIRRGVTSFNKVPVVTD